MGEELKILIKRNLKCFYENISLCLKKLWRNRTFSALQKGLISFEKDAILKIQSLQIS